MRLGLTTLHAANGRRAPDEQHTLLDLRRLLTDAGHRRWVLGDVSETYIRTLWDAYEREGSSARDERLVPVTTRLDAYSLSRPALAVLGQSRSTVDIPSILEGGGVLLVNTASGTLGGQVGTLVGGAIVSLVESTVRGYERMAPQDRPRTLLVVDEAQAIVGIDYERMLSELRKYGLTMMLATQNLTRLKEISDSMQATVMSNNGTLVVFRISAEDAKTDGWRAGKGKGQRGRHQGLGRSRSVRQPRPRWKAPGLIQNEIEAASEWGPRDRGAHTGCG